MTVLSASYETLSAMITPALFLTASGSLIISTSNRMARISDRVRILNETIDRLDRGLGDTDFVQDRIRLAEGQLSRMTRRNRRIRSALTYLYLALASFTATSLLIAVDSWVGHRISVVPTTLAIGGVLLLTAACIKLSREGLAALHGEDLEVRFYRALRERRRTMDAKIEVQTSDGFLNAAIVATPADSSVLTTPGASQTLTSPVDLR